MCDFDVCPACFNKKDKATGEGMLRGDKGLKPMETLRLSQYLKRGLRRARPEISGTLTLTLTLTLPLPLTLTRLARPEIPLFLLALCCVVGTASINLFLPNFQVRGRARARGRAPAQG